jgi:hypothetical protein
MLQQEKTDVVIVRFDAAISKMARKLIDISDNR